jgi:hypothetical protein
MEFYPWWVFAHIAGVLIFALGHGASAIMSFAIRREREPTRITALLDSSSMSLGVMYLGLLLLLIGGIGAGIVGAWFTRSGWIWAALGLLIIIIIAMYVMASNYYGNVRKALGQKGFRDPKDAPPPAPVSTDELVAMLDTRRPEAITVVGVGGLLIILWLMVLKPF